MREEPHEEPATPQQQYDQARQQRKGRIMRAPSAPSMLPSPSSPLQVARCFVQANCLYDDKTEELTLRYWGGSYWSWCGTHWIEIFARNVRARLYAFTEHATYINAEMEVKE